MKKPNLDRAEVFSAETEARLAGKVGSTKAAQIMAAIDENFAMNGTLYLTIDDCGAESHYRVAGAGVRAWLVASQADLVPVAADKLDGARLVHTVGDAVKYHYYVGGGTPGREVFFDELLANEIDPGDRYGESPELPSVLLDLLKERHVGHKLEVTNLGSGAAKSRDRRTEKAAERAEMLRNLWRDMQANKGGAVTAGMVHKKLLARPEVRKRWLGSRDAPVPALSTIQRAIGK